MEIIREFVGDKQKAFDIIMEALLSDIETETGESVNAEEITEGFRYIKKLTNRFGNEGNIEVTINSLDVPNYYEAHFQSQQGLNELSYELIDKGEDIFELIYKESFEGEKSSYNLNFKLMSFLFKRSSKKRVKLMLDKLQVLLNQ